MKCHYEVLGIERNADDKTIKNAYRKLALKFHPDKNLDDVDAAKEQFLLVQQAYDVLSDPQERAWYDNHREQILRGSQTDYEDESLDVFPYFTAACYKGFGDDSDGFYAVYAKVFDQIAAEDIEFMATADEYEQIPKFGTSASDYDTIVGPFYAHWQSYCTKKTYTWLCPHNINEIRDRRILREIEKETKKIAQKKRKERNDEIRALVAFVRKRDKRVQEYRKRLEAKAEENRLKQQQRRLAQLQKNQQAAAEAQKHTSNAFNASDHEEQLRQLEQAYGSDTDSELDQYENEMTDNECADDENDETAAEKYFIDDLYCVACNKTFKNVSSFENHESSKKHRENAERLRKVMQKEDEQFNDDDNDDDDDDGGGNSDLNADEIASESGSELAEDVAPTKTPKSSKKSKKSKKRNTQHKITDIDSDHELDEVNSSMADVNIANISDADKDAWSDDGGGKKKKKAKTKKINKKSTKTPDAGDCQPIMVKQKTVNKNATTSTSETVNDTNHTCVTCHATFESKNKLFAHLKKTNHGVYIPKTEKETTKKKIK